MYKLLNQINNVKNFCLSNGSIFLISEEGVLLKDFEPLYKDVDYRSLTSNSIGITYKINSIREILINDKTYNLNSRFFPETLNPSKIVTKDNWRRGANRFEFELGIFNFKSNSQEISSNHTNYSILGSLEKYYTATKNNKLIALFYKNTLDKFWEIDLEVILGEGIKFAKYFGCIDDKLIFSAENNMIFVLHKFSGTLLKKYRDLPGINKGSFIENVIPDSKSFVLDQEKKLLFGVFGGNYVEINIENESIFFENLSEEMQRYDITFLLLLNNNPFTDDHLFVTTLKDTLVNGKRSHCNSLIALNRSSYEIDWEYTFTGDGIGTNIPLLQDDLLIQKSLDETLYVFQKEQTKVS